MQTLRSLLEHITNIVFPQKCVGCGMHGILLCENCISHTSGTPSTTHSFITSVFDYKNPIIRKAIWRFKYKNIRSFAKLFGEKIYEEILGSLGENLFISTKQKFLIVPIPLHKKRHHKRGYNQSELIAQEIIKNDTENIFELNIKVLVRIKETKPQAKSEKRANRFKNLHNAFKASKEVSDRDIILIDDITTTGATLSEAHKSLKRAGARTVCAFTVAH